MIDQDRLTEGGKRSWIPPERTSQIALVAYAICLAPHQSNRSWAVGWLSGRDRSSMAAKAGAAAAQKAANRLEWASRVEALAASEAAFAAAELVSRFHLIPGARRSAVVFRMNRATELVSVLYSDHFAHQRRALERSIAILAGELSAEHFDCESFDTWEDAGNE